MRSVNKGPAPLDDNDLPVVFEAYQDAARHLKERLGRYCSYCERTIPVGLAVEHKRPKEHHPLLERAWENFLLACANCNSSKGHSNPAIDSVVWPDEHDPFNLIAYMPNGAVRPRAGLAPGLEAKVRATLARLGISKAPEEMSALDHRLFDRLEIWRRAAQSREDLANSDLPALRRAIVETAKASGGYSIWQAAFELDAAMRDALSRSFVGTRAAA